MSDENTNDDKKQQFEITNNTNFTPLSNEISGMRSLNDDSYKTGNRRFDSNIYQQNNYRSVMGPLNISSGDPLSHLLGGGVGSNLTPLRSKNNLTQFISKPISKPNEPIQQKQKQITNVPKWVGPMNQFTTFKSCFDANALGNQIENILDEMVLKGDIDYSRNKTHSFLGRMYSRNDLSEFQVQLYQNGQENDKSTKTILELRRTSGDSFVHEDFFNHVTKELSQSKFINLTDDQNSFGGLEPLSLKDFILDNDDDDEDNDDEDFDMNENSDIDMDDNSLTLESNNTKEWAEDLLEVLIDRDSFRDTWRHSATQLCFELRNKNKEMMDYVTKQDKIIDKIFKPVTQQLYDCLIIKTVLEIVIILLGENVKPEDGQRMIDDIERLSKDWSNGPQRSMGPLTMSFTRSQQICAQCNICKDVITKMLTGDDDDDEE